MDDPLIVSIDPSDPLGFGYGAKEPWCVTIRSGPNLEYIPYLSFEKPGQAVSVAADLAASLKSNGKKVGPILTLPTTDTLLSVIDVEIETTRDAFFDDPDPEMDLGSYLWGLQSIEAYRLRLQRDQEKQIIKNLGEDWDYHEKRKQHGLELIGPRTPKEALEKIEQEIIECKESPIDIHQAKCLYDAMTAQIETFEDDPELLDVNGDELYTIKTELDKVLHLKKED